MRATTAPAGFREVLRGFPKPAPGRPGDPGLFGPGSLVWKLNREAVMILGGPRALLMQIAHPMVAAGVADHSDFGTDSFARLWRTLDAVLTVAFGDSEQAAAAAASVNDLHARVVGERGEAAYSALDPELLLWVHATLVDTALATYERLVAPLPSAERERYYQEMKLFAAAFGLSEADAPSDLGAFYGYLRDTLAVLEVSPDARRLAPGILRPPTSISLAPVSGLVRFVTAGLLPARLRLEFGLAWNPARERAFEAFAACLQAGLPVVPARARTWPHALEADARAAANVR